MTRIGHVLIWLCLVSVCYAEDPVELVGDVKQQQQGPPANSNALPRQLQHPAVPEHTPSNHRGTTNKKDGQVDVSQRKLDADQVILNVAKENWKSQHARNILLKRKQDVEAAKHAEDDVTQTITQGSHPQLVLKNQRQKNPSQDDMDNTTQQHKTSKQIEADKAQPQGELEENNPAQKELETKEANENKKQEPENENQPQEKQDKDASPQTIQQTPQKQEQETSSENQITPDKPDTSAQLDADPSSTKQDKLSSQTQTQTQTQTLADAPKPQLHRKPRKQQPPFQGMASETKEEMKKEEHGQAQVQSPDDTNRVNGRTAPDDLIAKKLDANQAQSQSQSQPQQPEQTDETEKETLNGVKKLDTESTEDPDKEKEKQIKSQEPEKSQLPPSALFGPKHTPVTPQPRPVDRADTDIHAFVPDDETEQGKKRQHGRKSDEKETINKKKQDEDDEIKDETLNKNKENEKDDEILTNNKEKHDDILITTDDMGNKPKSKDKDSSVATIPKHGVDPDNDQTNLKQQQSNVDDTGNPKSKAKTEPEEDVTSNKEKTSVIDEKDANIKSESDEESMTTTTTKLKPVSGSGDDDSITNKKQSDNESIINKKDDKETSIQLDTTTTIKQDDKLIQENIKLKNKIEDLNNKLKELQKQIQHVRKQKEEDALALEKAQEAAKLAQQQVKIAQEKEKAEQARADIAAREPKLKEEEKELTKDEKESDELTKEEKDTDTNVEIQTKPQHPVPPIMLKETILIVTKRKDGDDDVKVSEDIKSEEKSEKLDSVETDKTERDKEKTEKTKADPPTEEPIIKYHPISPDDIPTRSSPPYRLILILSLIVFCVYVIRRVRRILDGDDFQSSDERTPKVVQMKNAISSALHSHDQPSSDLSLTPSPPSHARGISSGMSLKPSLPTKKTTTTTTTTEHTKPTSVESDTTDSFAGWDDNWSDMDTGTSEPASTTTTSSNNSMSLKPKASARGGIKKSILSKE